MKKRIPFLIAAAIGFFLWQGGFGFLATERQLVWRLPVSHADIRKIDLQLWDGETLLVREEKFVGDGLKSEPNTTIALRPGRYRSIASVWIADASAPRVFEREFDAESKSTIVVP